MTGSVLVLGAGGMLSTALADELRLYPFETIALSEEDCDITDASAVADAILKAAPRIVINCAAYTNVDGAESDAELALRVNADGAGNVARASAAAGARCVYISTDYVFDGKKAEPYVESDATRALNRYGESKAKGERECAAAAPDHAIIRSSWLYGPHGRNFVTTILRLGMEAKPLRVVADQVGTPTYTRDFSRAIVEIALGREGGIFHVTNSGTCSWYEFATAILNEAGIETEVIAISSDEYSAPARRPRNSRLASSRHGAFTPLPHWRDAMIRFLEEIGQRHGRS